MYEKLNFFDISFNYKKDKRGWYLDPFGSIGRSISPQGSFHIVSLLPGVIRGNHIHMATNEWIALWEGEFLFKWEEKNEVMEKILGSGKAYLIYVPEGVAHACKNIGKTEAFLFAYYEKKVLNYESDTIKKVILR